MGSAILPSSRHERGCRTNTRKMLSRVAQRSLKEVRPALVASRPTHTTAVNKSEERDEVNFPRRVRPVEPGKVRMGFIPEEFFQFLYPKTGVTGPYMFGVGVSTYLLSKEIYILEHEFYTGVSIALMLAYGIKKLGPGIGAYLDKEVSRTFNQQLKLRKNLSGRLRVNQCCLMPSG